MYCPLLKGQCLMKQCMWYCEQRNSAGEPVSKGCALKVMAEAMQSGQKPVI